MIGTKGDEQEGVDKTPAVKLSFSGQYMKAFVEIHFHRLTNRAVETLIKRDELSIGTIPGIIPIFHKRTLIYLNSN